MRRACEQTDTTRSNASILTQRGPCTACACYLCDPCHDKTHASKSTAKHKRISALDQQGNEKQIQRQRQHEKKVNKKRKTLDRHALPPMSFDEVAGKSEIRLSKGKASPRMKDFNQSILKPVLEKLDEGQNRFRDALAANATFQNRMLDIFARVLAPPRAPHGPHGAAPRANAAAAGDDAAPGALTDDDHEMAGNNGDA